MMITKTAPLLVVSCLFFILSFSFGCCAESMAGNEASLSISTSMSSAEQKVENDKYQVPPELAILKNIEKEIKGKSSDGAKYVLGNVPSLLFTPSQYALLRDARVGYVTRMPTFQELKETGDPDALSKKPSEASRYIKLGGIAFVNPDEWTIWLNASRITPDTLPSEVIDIKVYREFIELKWYDALSKQVYPIRLRPNQRFHLDTHMFLPG